LFPEELRTTLRYIREARASLDEAEQACVHLYYAGHEKPRRGATERITSSGHLDPTAVTALDPQRQKYNVGWRFFARKMELANAAVVSGTFEARKVWGAYDGKRDAQLLARSKAGPPPEPEPCRVDGCDGIRAEGRTVCRSCSDFKYRHKRYPTTNELAAKRREALSRGDLTQSIHAEHHAYLDEFQEMTLRQHFIHKRDTTRGAKDTL
jgi:hypothetical protein